MGDDTSDEGGTMQYALLIYGSEHQRDRMSEEESQAILGEYFQLLEAPGVLGAQALHPVASTTTVRVENGETLLTDGPYIDAKEHLGGFYLVEADDLDTATALAARIPAARLGGAVEVRPVVEEYR
jgi:hypothetical protein